MELLDFKIVAKLMKNKEHLTLTGLEQIRQIKSSAPYINAEWILK
jgi:hypothetical protein